MPFEIKITELGPMIFTDDELKDEKKIDETLAEMDAVTLRALIRNKSHNVDNQMQRYFLSAERTEIVLPNTTKTLRFALTAWEKRGYETDKEDIEYGYHALRRADEFSRNPVYHEIPPDEPFKKSEVKALEKAIFGRKSVRRFSDKDVPDDLLNKVLEAGFWAPCACSVQGCRFIVVKDPETKKIILQPWAAPVLVIGCMDDRCYKLIEGAELPNSPILDLALAFGNMHLMAHALGLGMTIGTFVGEIAALSRALEVPDYIKPLSYFNLGWPTDNPTRVPRMELEGYVSREKWTGE